MRPLRRRWAQLRALPSRRRAHDIAAELDAHLRLATEDHQRAGLSPVEARRQALVQLGGLRQAEEACGEQWTWHWLDALRRDLGDALRQMRRQPGFAISVVLILGLAIGATTTAFSALEALILRPFPYRQPSRLVKLWDDYGTPGNTSPVSFPDFQDWRRWNHSFTAMSVLAPATYSLLTTGAPVHVDGQTVSPSAFAMLGVRPLLGRGFRPGESRPGADAGADPMVLSYGFWRSQFGGARSALGRVVQMDGRPYEIVGVMPRGFAFPPGQRTEIWTTTAALWTRDGGHPPIATNRGYSFLSTIARLRPGVSLASAQADMNHVAGLLRRAHPRDDARTGVIIRGWQASEAAQAAPVAEILVALAALLWLAACASVGGLWLSRAAAQRHEAGIRDALGAGRARLAAQALTEGLVLAVLASALGGAIAAVATTSLNATLQLPPFYSLRLGWPVIAFAMGIVVVSAATVSLLPALAPRRGGVLSALKTGGAGAGYGPAEGRARRVLAGAEVALAAVLLISAALLARSLAALEHVPLNFDPSGVLTFTLSTPPNFLPAQVAARYHALLASIRRLPGVISAASGDGGPLTDGENRTAVTELDGRKIPMRQWTGIEFSSLTTGYFRTLQIPLLRGRLFTPADNAQARPVIILNQAAARRYFGGANPLGHTLAPGMLTPIGGTRPDMWTVVGVVATAKEHALTGPPHAMLYLPLAQTGLGGQQFFVRAQGDPRSLVPAIRAVAARIDATQAVFGAQPLQQNYRAVLAMPQDMARFAMLFAALALLLTALGLYALVAFAAAQRRREISLRLALGAPPRAAIGLVVGQVTVAAGIGLAAGAIGAWAAGRLLASQLFRVRPADPLTFACSLAALAAIAACAAYVPARRAARIDPAESLRCE